MNDLGFSQACSWKCSIGPSKELSDSSRETRVMQSLHENFRRNCVKCKVNLHDHSFEIVQEY